MFGPNLQTFCTRTTKFGMVVVHSKGIMKIIMYGTMTLTQGHSDLEKKGRTEKKNLSRQLRRHVSYQISQKENLINFIFSWHPNHILAKAENMKYRGSIRFRSQVIKT